MHQPYRYPKEIKVRLHNCMMNCRLLKVHVDEMHPDEFGYLQMDVAIDDNRYASWMDETYKVNMKSLSRISKQEMWDAWRMEKAAKQNPFLAEYAQAFA